MSSGESQSGTWRHWPAPRVQAQVHRQPAWAGGAASPTIDTAAAAAINPSRIAPPSVATADRFNLRL